MKKKQIKKMIKALVARKHANNEMTDKLYELVGENKIEDELWTTYDALVDAVEELTGDKSNAISFFIFDCNCGESPREMTGRYPAFENAKQVAEFIKNG